MRLAPLALAACLFVAPQLSAADEPLGAGKPTTEKPTSGKPNVLWIIAEDMGADLACYGTPAVSTPNLDRLAAQGCRYTRAFSTAPICSAARSALMTGAYQTSFGAHHHRSNRQPQAPELSAGVKLLSDRFREAGYFTANLLHFPKVAGISSKGKTDWNFAYAGHPFDSADWQDLKPHQPFFAQVNFPEAHRIYTRVEAHPVDPAKVALPPYLADDPLVREDWAAYLNAIQTLDAKVGAVLDLLAAEGMADNTIVMFMGDNGREDFRGKYHLYEQGCAVPLIVRAPGYTQPGSVSEALVSGVDIAATTLSLAGIALPAGSHGKPFLGPRRAERDYVFTALDRIDDNPDRVRAVRDARWKYMRNFEPERPYLQDNGYRSTTNPTYLVMRKLHAQGRLNAAQSKFMARSRPEEELYDLENDPYELNNLAASPAHADQLALLRGKLKQWMHQTGDDRGEPEPQESLAFSLERYEAAQPKTLAKNLQVLRANYTHLDEVEPIVPEPPAQPATLLTTPGKLLVDEKLDRQPDKTAWHYGRGAWQIVDGTLKGMALEEQHHGAALRRSLPIHDVIIRYDFRMDGAQVTSLSVNDEQDHICSAKIKPNEFSIWKDDNDHEGPDKKRNLGTAAISIPPGTWHTLLVEIRGPEMVATLDGKLTLFGSDPLLEREKANFGFTVGGDGVSLRNLQAWEAVANPRWEATKAELEKNGGNAARR